MINSLLTILFSHFIADFVCQSDKMAKGKSTSLKWLSIHAGCYTVALYIGLVIGNLIGLIPDLNLYELFIFSLISGALHLITDFFTSKVNSYFYKKEQIHWFFVGVGFDQFLHSLALFKLFQTMI